MSNMQSAAIALTVLPIIVRSVVIVCDRVNGEQLALFAQQVKVIRNIPPTQHELARQVLRVRYEVGHVWD